MEKSRNQSNLFDYFSISLSVLCAIHCTVAPLLILFLPQIKGFFEHESFHLILFLTIVPFAIWTFYRCYKLHKDSSVLQIAFAGLACLLAGLLAEDLSEYAEQILTILGSLLLITAHIKNIKHCRCLKSFAKGESCSH